MNQHFRYLLAVVLLCLTANLALQAQVVIGSGLNPNKGSLLDLKETIDNPLGVNSNRGLLLPRVKLQAIDNLRPEGALFTGDLVHTGLAVYNLTHRPLDLLCKGVYVWTGTIWVFLHSKGCLCEYSIIGHDGKEYYIYCVDFEGSQTTASDICKTQAGTTQDTHHLMTEAEYMQIWDRPIRRYYG